MPESPEVQALVEFLDERIRGRVIAAVEIDEFRVVKTRDRPPGSLVGARIDGLTRFGKHVGFDTPGGWLMLGFGRNQYDRFVHFLYGLLVTPAAAEVIAAYMDCAP